MCVGRIHCENTTPQRAIMGLASGTKAFQTESFEMYGDELMQYSLSDVDREGIERHLVPRNVSRVRTSTDTLGNHE